MQRELDGLVDRLRERIRLRRYSLRTEQAYVDWVRRFARFHRQRSSSELTADDVEQFLSHLAVDLSVAVSTQNQAQSALLFFYREVLRQDLRWLDGVVRPKSPARLPVVLTVEEVQKLLRAMQGTHRLLGELLYGTGLRIMEALRLRVKDVDFGGSEILVRDGKGAKDRVTMLPRRLVQPLRRQIARAREMHADDVAEGFGHVWLPPALARKYPSASREWAWQYVFPRRSACGRPTRQRSAPPPHQRPIVPARDARGRPPFGHREAGLAAHATTFVRDSFARSGLRHPYRTGTPGTCRCEHDHDLHARSQSWRPRRCKSPRPPVTESNRPGVALTLVRLGTCARRVRFGACDVTLRAIEQRQFLEDLGIGGVRSVTFALDPMLDQQRIVDAPLRTQRARDHPPRNPRRFGVACLLAQRKRGFELR